MWHPFQCLYLCILYLLLVVVGWCWRMSFRVYSFPWNKHAAARPSTPCQFLQIWHVVKYFKGKHEIVKQSYCSGWILADLHIQSRPYEGSADKFGANRSLLAAFDNQFSSPVVTAGLPLYQPWGGFGWSDLAGWKPDKPKWRTNQPCIDRKVTWPDEQWVCGQLGTQNSRVIVSFWWKSMLARPWIYHT